MDQLLTIARAIACPARLELLRLIGVDGCSVSEAAERAGLATATTSHHLAILRSAGLATMKRVGRTRVYRWSTMRCSIALQYVPMEGSVSGD